MIVAWLALALALLALAIETLMLVLVFTVYTRAKPMLAMFAPPTMNTPTSANTADAATIFDHELPS